MHTDKIKSHHRRKHHRRKRHKEKSNKSRKDQFDKIPINDIERINSSKREYIPIGFKSRVINDEPYIVKINNFLTEDEADEIIELAHTEGFEKSNMIIDDEFVINDYRTSQTSYLLDDGCPYKYSKNIENLIKRICYLTRCKRTQIEGLMCVKYEGGEYFETHVDFFESNDERILEDAGNRILTFFVYLSTLDKGDGGETEFPELGIKSRPVKGDAVFWFNKVRGKMKHNTLHRGLPPINGKTKYGLNIWVHEREYN